MDNDNLNLIITGNITNRKVRKNNMYIKENIWELDKVGNDTSLLHNTDWYEAGFAGKSFTTVDEVLTSLIKSYGNSYEVIIDKEGLCEGFIFYTQECYSDCDELFDVMIQIEISTTLPYTEYMEKNITLPVMK